MKKLLIALIAIMLVFCVPVESQAGSTEETYEYIGNSKHRWKMIVNGRVKQKAIYSCSGNPCRWCNHYSSPPHYHNTNNYCGASHCGHRYCTCGSGASHNCGGGCTFGGWSVLSDGKHAQICTRGNCQAKSGTHTPVWEWTSAHTVTCKTCKIVGTHTVKWSNYEIKTDGTHARACLNTTVTHGGVTTNSGLTCPTIEQHAGVFTAYYKVNNGGESDGNSSHRSDCEYSACTLFSSHPATWKEWNSISDSQHRRSCTNAACGLTQTLSHTYQYAPIEDDIHYHTVTCSDCEYKIGSGNSLAKHTDKNPSDGFCDQCYLELVEIEYSPARTELTNSNVTVTITVFKDGAPGDEVQKSHVYTENNLNDLEEERYQFNFNDEGINWTDRPIVDHINKTVSGRIQYEPDQPTSGEVVIKFLPDYEEETYGEDYGKPEYGGRSKQIYARFLVDGVPVDEEWMVAENSSKIPTITYTFTQNGICEIEIKDSLGNGDPDAGKESVRIPVIVDWIVSGQATAATTSDILENGTVFTDILINTDKEWQMNNAQNQIAVKIYRVSGNTIKLEQEKSDNVKISKLEIKDFNENKLTETPIGRGLYYIKTGIGGPGIFTLAEGEEKTQYIVELSWVNAAGTAISGGNRIEVTVNKLNNLT